NRSETAASTRRSVTSGSPVAARVATRAPATEPAATQAPGPRATDPRRPPAEMLPGTGVVGAVAVGSLELSIRTIAQLGSDTCGSLPPDVAFVCENAGYLAGGLVL